MEESTEVEIGPPAKRQKLEVDFKPCDTEGAPTSSTNSSPSVPNSPQRSLESEDTENLLSSNSVCGNLNDTDNHVAEEADLVENPSSTSKPANLEILEEGSSEDEVESREPAVVTENQESDVNQPEKVKIKTKSKKQKKSKKGLKSSSEGDGSAQGSSKKKAAYQRRNIKDILNTDALGEETLAAQREEAERRQRIQLQQQQLKILHQQQILMKDSACDSSSNGVGTSPLTIEAIVNKIAQRKQQNSTAAIGPEEGNLTTESNESPTETPCFTNPVDEEIVLSSDEENNIPPKKNVMLNLLLDNSPHNLNKGFNGMYGHFGGTMRSRLDEHNVISLSSGDEESSNEMSPSKLSYGISNNHTSDFKTSDVCADDSDDDCVVISPSPEDEEVEKDERNIDELNVSDEFGRVLVNVGHPDEDPDMFLAPQIARIVKPHQIGGIRFLYDNVVESIERFDTSCGFGCILAHSMGLGKSIQTVSFCDVFLRVSKSKARTILIIVPINTIQNWVNEFNMWLPTANAKNPNPLLKSRKRRNKVTKTANEMNDLDQAKATSGPGTPSLNGVNDQFSDTVSLNLTFDSTLNLCGMLSNEDSSDSRKPATGEDTAEADSEESLEVHHRSFEVFVLNETVKTLQAREKIISEWSCKGGVLLIGYEMYRMLALKKLKKSTKKQPQQSFFSTYGIDKSEADSLDRIHTCLVNPGPDLVICDEGHRIKNSGASISNALKAIRTRRRVVLTGYPLQNNLMEYWCMVDFIRPNYLGSKVEFSNMFERPISNGQCVDSTIEDRRLMRYRSHVLHSLLEGFVQRRSHAVLQSALPDKQEWVFLLKMTPIQYQLYKEFIKYLSENLEGQSAANPIKAFAVCCKIWNHPDALYNVVKKKQSILDDLDLDEVTANTDGTGTKSRGRGVKNQKKDLQGSQQADQISYFDGSGFSFPRNTFGGYNGTGPGASSGKSDQALSLDWALPIFQNYQPGVLENGVKFEILFEIIKESVHFKDKLLVFSQSLLSLDLIEIFLAQKFQWTKNQQYYRLDGSTTGLERERLVNNFNAKPEIFVFLVSTRAGSLGINLTGANRVVVLDASWNPCHDCQAVCRIYRYGQTKRCQIYRFVSDCTLEKRIYDRQINKRGMSDRVVDEMNPNAQFKTKDVSSFLVLQHDHLDKLPYVRWNLLPEKYSDPALQNLLARVGYKLTQEPFEHESLLIDQKSQRLSATEKRLAHRNYINEKRTASLQSTSGYTYSRPSYAAFYPKDSAMSGSGSSSSVAHQSRVGGYTNSGTNYRQFQLSNEDRFEQHVAALREKGICVQNIVLKKDAFLADPGGGPDMFIMAGEKVYVLRSDKGTYLRISNGKLIAVRNNTANSRIPGMNVPANIELTKEQLQGLVYAFLKVPGQHTYDSFQSSSVGSSTYPPEQPLPPSPNFFSQSRNHLQVTNSRNNSGGDVTVWQEKDSNHSRSFSANSEARSSPNFENSGRTLGSPGRNAFSNSNLERLSYLANQFPGFTPNEFGYQNARSNSSPQSSSCYDPLVRLSSTPPSLLQNRHMSNGSPSAQPDLEVIAIPKSSSSIRSTKSSSNDSDSFSSGRSVHNQRKRSTGRVLVGSTVAERNPQEILDVNSSFYKDFTITLKSQKGESSSGLKATKSSHHDLPSVKDFSSAWMESFGSNANGIHTAESFSQNSENSLPSTVVASSSVNNSIDTFDSLNYTSNERVTNVESDSGQYYSNGNSNPAGDNSSNSIMGGTANCNSSASYDEHASVQRNESIYFPYQGV